MPKADLYGSKYKVSYRGRVAVLDAIDKVNAKTTRDAILGFEKFYGKRAEKYVISVMKELMFLGFLTKVWEHSKPVYKITKQGKEWLYYFRHAIKEKCKHVDNS